MFYLCAALFRQDNGNDVEAKGAVINFICCEEITCGPEQFSFFRRSNNILGWCKIFSCSGFYLDENERPVGSDHNKVNFAGFAGEISGERFKGFSF